MTLKWEKLAHDLAAAWKNGSTIPLPAAGEGPASRAEAYAIQDRMAELIGGKVVGWKVGATVRAVQMFEGHDGPLPGRIFADRCYNTSAKVDAKLYKGAKVECEFAFRLTKALPAGKGVVTAADIAQIVTFHPAIELAAVRYAPGTGNRAANTFDGIADNGGAGAAVLGAAVTDWQHLSLETMAIDARIDGSPAIQAYSGPYRRSPLDITAETFSDLRARGVTLDAGTCVLTGSASLPTPIRPGQTLVARFGELAPLTLTFT
jgi:2-keto-4-pentenoate hydratase